MRIALEFSVFVIYFLMSCSGVPAPPPRPTKCPPPVPPRRRKTVSDMSSLSSPSLVRRHTAGSAEIEKHTLKEDNIKHVLDTWLTEAEATKGRNGQSSPISRSHSSKARNLFHLFTRNSQRPVFGVSLADLQREGPEIPILVFQCVVFLSTDRMSLVIML